MYLSVGLATPVACLCVLLSQDMLGRGSLTHVLAAIVSCRLRNSTLARFPGTVPAFLCASFHLFQVLACHCEIIQNLYGLESNGPNPNRKLAFSLFIWNYEAESVGHLFLLLH